LTQNVIPARTRPTIVNTEQVALLTDYVWNKKIVVTKRGGHSLMMLDEYSCDMCGFLFLPMTEKNLFCPSCGSSQVRKEMGSNELSDEDVYVTILTGKEKASFIF
jgi:hypothetical protein